MKLRANEGLTYGASSYFEPSRFAGIFEASTFTRTEKTADAVKMLVDLLKEFRENPATDAEFDEAKAYLSGSFAIATETAASVAARVLTAEVNGLGEDYWARYRERLDGTTRAEVEAAVRRFLRPDRLAITAVGNAKGFAPATGSVRPPAGDSGGRARPGCARPAQAEALRRWFIRGFFIRCRLQGGGSAPGAAKIPAGSERLSVSSGPREAGCIPGKTGTSGQPQKEDSSSASAGGNRVRNGSAGPGDVIRRGQPELSPWRMLQVVGALRPLGRIRLSAGSAGLAPR
jgi:hypothetical protein